MQSDRLKCAHCGQAIPQASGIVADRDRREIRFRECVVYAPSHEFEIFVFLLERIGRVISKESFMSFLYQLVDEEPEIKIIDIFICKLRKKLRGTGLEIRTWWGRGYSLEVPKQEANEEHVDVVAEDTEAAVERC